MASTTIFDLEVEAGTTTTIDFFLKEVDETTPFDLTDWHARMHVRAAYNAPGDPLLDYTSDNNDIELDIGLGRCRLVIEPEDTNGIPAPRQGRELVYDIEVFDNAGVVFRPFKGIFKLYPQVTVE